MDLLLFADPSQVIVEEYMQRGECFVAESKSQVIGVYVLLPTRSETVELVNITLIETHHGKGFGKQLVINAIEVAKAKGYRTLEVGTGNSSIG